MTYLSESFLAATRLALGMPPTAVPRGPKLPYRCKPQAAGDFGRVLRYPALMPPRSSVPGPSARPGPAASLHSSQSCR